MIRAAGIMLLCDDKALFLKRADTGQWAFPGGGIEGNETAEEAAEREAREEIGTPPHLATSMWMRRIADEVDFTTFRAMAETEFTPTLNEEHTAWTWAPVTDPPLPLHPGVAVALAKMTANELGIARMMAAGDLTSPQKYGTFLLWNIRITGTGLAYRDSRNEFCWRPEATYLNDDFLARSNGLPVIFVHPEKKPTLDSEEYNDRSVGSVFLPFLRGKEVWAVAKIYDAATIDALLAEPEGFSTSPNVVFGDDSGNRTLKTEDGSTLLIEGKPALLDHIAIVPNGVWDKGGPPNGVQTDSFSTPTNEGDTMAEEERKDSEELHKKLDHVADALGRIHSRMDAMEMEDKARKDAEEREREDHARMDAACKDKFGHRKDGEAHKDWKARHDADEMAMCDALEKGGVEKDKARQDAAKRRKDAEEAEAGEGGESFKKWAEEEGKEGEHKDARKDAEEKEAKEREEKERMDAAHRADATATENKALRDQLADLTRTVSQITAITTPEERNAIAHAQSRADGVHGLFGNRAPAPIPGEKPSDYRRRLADGLKQHSATFKGKSLASLDDDMLTMVEERVYADAATAARSPDRAGLGVLIPIRERDEAGREITRWTGDNMVWMAPFMSGAQLGSIVRPNRTS